jgi:hypothetical protein
MGVRGQSHAPAILLPEMARYPLYKGLGGTPGRSGWVRKNLAPTRIRFPYRPNGSKSLQRLRYQAPPVFLLTVLMWILCTDVITLTEENLLQCHFLHRKSVIEWSGTEPRPQRLEAGDYRTPVPTTQRSQQVTSFVFFVATLYETDQCSSGKQTLIIERII